MAAPTINRGTPQNKDSDGILRMYYFLTHLKFREGGCSRYPELPSLRSTPYLPTCGRHLNDRRWIGPRQSVICYLQKRTDHYRTSSCDPVMNRCDYSLILERSDNSC